MGGNENITEDSNIVGGLNIAKGRVVIAVVDDGEEKGGQKNKLRSTLS